MDLDLTDEQTMLAETVGRLLDQRYEPNTRLALLKSADGWSREMWSRYAEIGLLGLPFDEQYGGAGMGAAEVAVVAEAFGRALVLEPYLATVVLGGGLVAAAGTPEQKAAVLPAVAEGTLLLALAHEEPGSRWSLEDVSTTAAQDGDTWTVTGEKTGVLGGDSAEKFVVTARTADGGFALLLVDAADVRRDAYTQQDGLRAADVLFDAAPAQLLGDPAEAAGHLRDVLDTAQACLAAEAVGAMDVMLNLTVDYLKTRVQFGAPIAVFQALQHRAADLVVDLEQARSMALLARLALAGDDRDERTRTIRAAKVQIDLSGKHIGQEAIQLHGGIGMTMEYPVGHYVKRVTVIGLTFGDLDLELRELAAAGGIAN